MELDIKQVEHITHFPFPDENGKKIAVASPHFRVTSKNGDVVKVPLDPANRHYREIAEWHKNKKIKTFKFSFEELA